MASSNMGWEFLNKAPPWLIVLMFISMGGVGGGGLTAFLQPNTGIKETLERVNATLTNLDEAIETLERKNENLSWRLDSHSDRLNGHATKNKEQDRSLHKLEIDLTRFDARGR